MKGIKTGDTIIMKSFTGTAMGVFEVVAETEKTFTVLKKNGQKVIFSKKTGKQINVEEGKERYANYAIENDGSYKSIRPTDQEKDGVEEKPKKKKPAKKVKEVEEVEEVEEIEEIEKPKKKKPAKRPVKKVEDLEDLDEIEETEEVEEKPKKKTKKKPAVQKVYEAVEEDEDDDF